MWRNILAPANSCSRELCTSSVIFCYCRPHVLTCHSTKHLSNFRRQPTHSVVRSLQRSSILLTTADNEHAQFWQHDCCYSSRFPSVAHQPVILKTSPSLSSSFSCNNVKTVEHLNQPNFHQFRHYIPRQLTPSTKTIVDASPLSLQPYLRLIRFDRPIGIAAFICCLFN